MSQTWLEQKLAQNGFNFQDLSDQTGLSVQELKSLSQSERGSSTQWDLVLSVLNEYPSVRIPSEDILNQLQQDLDTYPDGNVVVYYGAEDGALLFCGYLNLQDNLYHGSNTAKEYLSPLSCSLQDALLLFTRQNNTASA